MFFNSEPERFFPYAQIDVVQFPEGDAGDKIIEQTFKGPLHEQLRAALRYIRNTVITEQVVKVPDQAEAERFFNYPYDAIEEALSNAIYCNDYQTIGDSVTENVVENVVEKLPETVNAYLNTCSKKKVEKARKIISAIVKNRYITITEMASAASTTDRTVQRYLKEFQDNGILRREGSDTSGEWILM